MSRPGWPPRIPPTPSPWRGRATSSCARPTPRPAPRERTAGGRAGVGLVPVLPIPEVARLGRTLRAWRSQLLADFSTTGVSNGGTEASNLIIEKTRRLAHRFRNFRNYRIRILLVADRTRPYRPRPNHA